MQMVKQPKDVFANREPAQQALISLATTLSSTSGENFFDKVCHHLTTALNVDYALIGKLIESKNRVSLVAGVGHGKSMELPLEYDLKDTPCATTVGQSFCVYPSSVQELFPKDKMLSDMGASVYMGMPLISSSGDPLGLIVVTDSQSAKDIELAESLLKIFSDRVAVELERSHLYQAHRGSEHRHTLLADTLPNGVLENDLDGTITFANAALHRIYGVKPGELIGRHIWDFELTNAARSIHRV